VLGLTLREMLTPIDAAVLAVRWAVREGATEAEAYAIAVRGHRATARAGRIETLEFVDDSGIAVRAAVGKRVGFAYTTSLEKERVKDAARKAVAIAKASPEDRYWKGFPSPSSVYPEPEAMFNPSLASVEASTIVDKVREAIEVTREAKAMLVFGAASAVKVERAIASTSGTYRVDVGTQAYVTAAVSVEVEGGVRSPAIYEYESSRVSVPSGESVARRALERALLCKRRVKIDAARRMDVVFTASALASMLPYTIGFALRGDSAVRGRSPYAGREGEQVASEKLTVIDDGTLRGGDATWRFDGEGVATSRKVLVERGVLRSFVFDSYWGRRAGRDSTGNAIRPGYEAPPLPGFTNTIIEPGDANLDELTEGEVLVLYQVQGAHSSNPETGEYSVLANPAILYRDGEPVGWAVGVMVSSNFYEDLRDRLTLVSRFYEHPSHGYYLPWMRLEGVMVAPKA
jgi:PmbA protein